MSVKFDVKYTRSKAKVTKKIGLDNIVKTEALYKVDSSDTKLQLKTIYCRKDKNKQSIRVLGNNG